MKYYEIHNSVDLQIVGSFPQVENANHNCNVWNEPNFIDNFHFEKINVIPITSNAILNKKAKLTDLISASIIGFSLKLLISKELKEIIKVHSNTSCQFFEAPIIYKNNYNHNYWLVYPYEINLQNIDFEKSTFALRKRSAEGGTFTENIDVKTIDKFQEILNAREELNYSYFFIKRIVLKANLKDDFFVLRYVEGGIKYIISEDLKKEIENVNCTGIEFRPMD